MRFGDSPNGYFCGRQRPGTMPRATREEHDMGYGIGGILILILVILAIIYFAKRV